MTRKSPVDTVSLWTLVLLTVAILYASIAVAQTSGPLEKSPRDTVEQFWKLEISGGRLTPEGWYDASRFFVRMDPSDSYAKTVHVTSHGSAVKVEETARTETWAEVSVSPYLLGDIDPSLRFAPTPKRGAYGVVNLAWTTMAFHLVFASKQWKINQDGGRDKESVGPPQWLIDCDQRDLWLDKGAAIRYVTDTRNKNTNPTIKRNADATLAQLAKLQ